MNEKTFTQRAEELLSKLSLEEKQQHGGTTACDPAH